MRQSCAGIKGVYLGAAKGQNTKSGLKADLRKERSQFLCWQEISPVRLFARTIVPESLSSFAAAALAAWSVRRDRNPFHDILD